MNSNQSLIRELEDAIQSGSKDRRVDTLRRVTDLFLHDADRLSDQQITVFDDVLGHLIKTNESKALAELSNRLAPVDNAPVEVVRSLARSDAIDVAGPILEQSKRLIASDLVEIAKTKGQEHLRAISGRTSLESTVTDVLLERGDQSVVVRLAENSGARFSDAGFKTLVKKSETDENLASKVGLRIDIPMQLFRQLLLRATEAVRSRLLAFSSPESQAEIRRILAAVSNDVDHQAAAAIDYPGAQRLVLLMKKKGELDEAALLDFARTNRYAEMIAALSLMCSAPLELVERLLHNEKREVFLILCKVAGLEWPTVRAILKSQSAGQAISDLDLDRAKSDYIRLSKATAERVLRFWQVRQKASQDTALSPA